MSYVEQLKTTTQKIIQEKKLSVGKYFETEYAMVHSYKKLFEIIDLMTNDFNKGIDTYKSIVDPNNENPSLEFQMYAHRFDDTYIRNTLEFVLGITETKDSLCRLESIYLDMNDNRAQEIFDLRDRISKSSSPQINEKGEHIIDTSQVDNVLKNSTYDLRTIEEALKS